MPIKSLVGRKAKEEVVCKDFGARATKLAQTEFTQCFLCIPSMRIHFVVLASSCCFTLNAIGMQMNTYFLVTRQRTVRLCGPGQSRIHTTKRLRPHVAQTTSECGRSDWISTHLGCIHTCTCDRHPRHLLMLMPGVNRVYVSDKTNATTISSCNNSIADIITISFSLSTQPVKADARRRLEPRGF